MKKSLAITIFCCSARSCSAWGPTPGRWTRSSRALGASPGPGARRPWASSRPALAGLSEASREALCSNDAAMQSSLAAKAAANAASAVTALAAMPCSTQELETLALYLNGAGTTPSPSRADAPGAKSSARPSARASPPSPGPSAGYRARRAAYSPHSRTASSASTNTARPSRARRAPWARPLAELDAALDEFPELEYSGRYSSRDTSAALLASFTPVDSETARRKAAEFLGVERSALSPAGKSAAEVPCFAFDFEDGRVNVTETGGVVLSMSSALAGGEARITAEEAQNMANRS